MVDSRLDLLENYWSHFCEGHVQLLAAEEMPVREYLQGDGYSTAEDCYVQGRGLLLDYRAKLLPKNDNVDANPPSVSSEDGSTTNVALARLPRITLPTFSGRQQDWDSFRDLFTDLIHNNTALRDATKLLYLKTNVDGAAADALHEFKPTDHDYATAWEVLKSRYDQPKLQVQDHLEALLSLSLLKEESAQDLQSLLDKIKRHRNLLEALKRPVDHWNDWFVYLTSKAMDEVTRRVWEEELGDEERTKGKLEASFDRLADFLQRRCRTLRSIAASQPQPQPPTPASAPKRIGAGTIRTHATGTQQGKGCPACKEAHYIGHCLTFRGLDPNERRRLVSDRGLCFNCLSGSHSVRNCPSQSTSRSCFGTHHTLIHEGAGKRPGAAEADERNPKQPRVQTAATRANSTSAGSGGPRKISILPTVIASIGDGGSAREPVRALLDPCSEVTLVTLDFARKLGCKLKRVNVGITGVAGSVMDSACHQTTVWLSDLREKQPRRVEVFVLRSIGIMTPSGSPDSNFSEIKRGLQLADPSFDRPGKVDVVLGADVYKDVVRPGLHYRGPLVAQQTAFGWAITGCVTGATAEFPMVNSCVTFPSTNTELSHEALLGLVQRFWALEEVPQVHRLSRSDHECEEIYQTDRDRDAERRYIVPLPLKPEIAALLGDGLPQSQAALASMHRRMQGDDSLRDHYCRFMEQYEQLGHMRLLTAEELADTSGQIHYLSHHGIWQRSDEGRKLRVVFNASRPTDLGYSLNDALHSGPKLQTHIATVITRWRRHRVVFCTDIKMMFRQIKITSRDIHLQRIPWSPSPEMPVKHYVLLTVTYGDASAPYLALRTLRQLCADEGAAFPQAAETVQQDLYMDDFLSGSQDLESAKSLRDQLIGLLRAGGFSLGKWVANDPALLDEIRTEDRLRPEWVNFSTEGPVSELGVAWDPVQDQFRFRSPPTNTSVPLTKRKALAEVARIFDPLGWLAPLVLVAKLIIQDLWRANLGWDEGLPQPWVNRGLAFRVVMESIDNISIPRWLGHTQAKAIQLHAFSDASRRAMAGVVYSRSETHDGKILVTLVGAKTKLASIKTLVPHSRPSSRMTIPRLELRAALIAAQLLKTNSATLGIPMTSCHLWSDSRIVLHWLQSDGSVGNDLVDNYVVHIQEVAAETKLHHVPTHSNPADIASRGAVALKLISHSLWWNGPDWLSRSKEEWPAGESQIDCGNEPLDAAKQSTIRCHLATMDKPPRTDHTESFSTLGALVRGTARSRRLIKRRIAPSAERPSMDPLTADESRHAFLTFVRLSQRQDFTSELEQLSRYQTLPSHSPSKSLEPFVDDDGILRVGGRLNNSALPYDERHPVLLHGESHLARLVIRWAHERSLHGGFRATYARVIQRAWVTGGKIRIKKYLRQCLVCVRLSARVIAQGMVPLPAARVTPSRPFGKCGVDYAAPFSICRAVGRGMSTFKGYVALFVCMSTKAVHLELAGDLTTASFLGAITRFVGRRGRPSEIWSDNGTNFRGADLELGRLLRGAELDWGSVEGRLAEEGISWKFILPAAPHFGGLWEAGVKSMKVHLRRVVGPRRLTYEEFATLLVSIEAVLNSRLLAPPAGDLGDLDPLTPSHFLIGTSATSFPQPVSPEADLEGTTHWALVKAMRDSF